MSTRQTYNQAMAETGEGSQPTVGAGGQVPELSEAVLEAIAARVVAQLAGGPPRGIPTPGAGSHSERSQGKFGSLRA